MKRYVVFEGLPDRNILDEDLVADVEAESPQDSIRQWTDTFDQQIRGVVVHDGKRRDYFKTSYGCQVFEVPGEPLTYNLREAASIEFVRSIAECVAVAEISL